jgi:hypothetical protein
VSAEMQTKQTHKILSALRARERPKQMPGLLGLQRDDAIAAVLASSSNAERLPLTR